MMFLFDVSRPRTGHRPVSTTALHIKQWVNIHHDVFIWRITTKDGSPTRLYDGIAYKAMGDIHDDGFT